MPHIIIKGMQVGDVKKISKAMVDELEVIVGCPREYFTLECMETHFIIDGEDVCKDPFIQINWFDRGQEIQDQTALAITKHIEAAGYKNVEMFFTMLERNNYYENGTHL
jgi:hypothetical protein